MRSLLVGLLLVATVLAGCASEPVDTPVDIPDTTTSQPTLVQSHPAYGYLTNSDLAEGNMSDFPAPGMWNRSNPPGADAWKKPAQRELPNLLQTMSFEARTTETKGAGIAIFGPLAFTGATGGPVSIVNIMDPSNPQVVGTVDAPGRDIDTILYPDGRLVIVSTAGGRVITFTDVTDVYNPEIIAQIETPHTNHNLAVVPGTPIVYNSPSNGNGEAIAPTVGDPRSEGVAYTDIIDASDPVNPVVVKEWQNGYGCHDMTFYVNATEGKYRGYCAGIEALQIWDLTNATDPSVITTFGWPAGGVHDTTAVSLVTFAHLAMPNHDASILILGDETGGGAAPGCDISANVAGNTVTGPLGNLWFYDITDETNPVLKGSVSPSAYEQRGSCTAHFGKVIEDTNHAVVGFYSAGVALVDFTDPQNPFIKDRYEQPMPGPLAEGAGAGTIWDVWYYQGYLFTGDTQNGLDVLTLN